MIKSNNKKIIVLWGLVLITVQLSSFKYFPSFMSSILMKPLAIYPILFLFPMLLVILYKKEKLFKLPFNLEILIALTSMFFVTTIIGYIISVSNPFALENYLKQSVKSYVSLFSGIVFFLTSFFITKNIIYEKKNRYFLYIAIYIALFWGGIQALTIHTSLIEISQIEDIQRFFASGRTDVTRVYGFAFEPSWFADQIGIFFLPWIVATIYTGKYLNQQYKWVELLIFLFLFFLLFLSYSRSGMLNISIAFIVVSIFYGKMHIINFIKWFFSKTINKSQLLAKILIISLPILLLPFISSIIFGRGYLGNLFSNDLSRGLIQYIINNSAGPRLAYSIGGLKVFAAHPWTGVGFGTSGFYIMNNLPIWSLNMQEITRSLSPATFQIMNPKNMYVRLLAETGLVGFWIFISFLLSILSKIVQMLNNKLQDAQFIGIVGLFAWIVIVLRFFSIDSLTFPVMWMTLGMFLGFAARIEETGSLDEIG